MQELFSQIEEQLRKPLPGKEAQYAMAPMGRQKDYDPETLSQAKKSAVLLLLNPENDLVSVPFIVRKNYKGVHSSQIGLPGGKKEIGDGSLEETALRETMEEIGADTNAIRLIGGLSELYIPVSNYLVKPYVGYSLHRQYFIPEEAEVERILEFGLHELQSDIIKTRKTVTVQGGISINTPCFYIKGQIIWGATAMMLNEFLSILNKIESPRT